MPTHIEVAQAPAEPSAHAPSALVGLVRRSRALYDEIRLDPARWGSYFVVLAAAAAFALWLLNFSRHQWFVTDEFDYFNYNHEPLISWLLQPHNEHTIVFTKAWFALLDSLVGLRHYELYMVPLVAAHLVVVAAIYWLTWKATHSRVVTTGVALVALVMGAGVGTLTWAGQLQYVGSVAAGLIVLSLAIERSGRTALAIAISAAAFGTLNGSAFAAFGLAAAVVYARRRLWIEASLVAAMPLAWEAINRIVWAPQDPYAATGIGQILREGPAFAYSIFDTAISLTLQETHLSSVVLTALVLGTLGLISADLRWRRTAMSGRVVIALALASIFTTLSLVVARLSLPPSSWGGAGYAYLILVTLVPIGGILLAHIARTRATLLGIGCLLLVITLMGANTFHANAAGLQSWKTNGEQLLQTAAAELNAGMPTFPDQNPVPDTAPTVTQDRLRALAASGQLDGLVASPVDADQVSLNMQWRLVGVDQPEGICRNLSAGQSFDMSVGASASMVGLSPGAAVDLQYTSSSATRHLTIPNATTSLQTVSQRSAIATIGAGMVQVCVPSWG